MTETRFYPLLDTDDSGKHKTPMFFSNSEETVRSHHRFYLKESVPGYYRLCSVSPLTGQMLTALSIGCPHCGKMMKAITKFHSTQNSVLYCCPVCKPNKNTNKEVSQYET